MNNYLIELEKDTVIKIMNEHIERAHLGLWLSVLIWIYSIMNVTFPYIFYGELHIHFWDPVFFVIGFSMSIGMLYAILKLKRIKKLIEESEEQNVKQD